MGGTEVGNQPAGTNDDLDSLRTVTATSIAYEDGFLCHEDSFDWAAQHTFGALDSVFCWSDVPRIGVGF